MTIHELKSDMSAKCGAVVKPNAVYMMPEVNMNAAALSGIAQAMAAENPDEETAMLIVKGPGAKAIIEQIKKELDARAAAQKN